MSSQLVPSEDLLCSEIDVYHLLTSLNVTKSCGPDDVTPYMLKFTASSISLPITMLFNMSISLGCVPLQWKEARITPVPKISKPLSPSHFRPISLLSILSKLLEKHIHSLMCDHLNRFNLLSDQQWGFRPGRSTVTALLSTISDWHSELDNGHDICAVFFDYRKAFDSVPHWPLIEKLEALNFDPVIIVWITNYLFGRSQKVVVNGETSATVPVLSGVPQGSVLGPLLFCIYVDGVTKCTKSQGARDALYADDLMLYKPISCTQDLSDLQEDILNIEKWSADNHLTLNPVKCKCMLISRRRSSLSCSFSLWLNGNVLEQVNSFKYLGVNISSNLTWSLHIDIVCNKARRMLGIIYRNFCAYCNTASLLKLYISLVRPHLEYASPVWSPYSAKQIAKIENVQKFGLRIVSGDWSADYNNLLVTYLIPTLQMRRSELSLCLLYKITKGECFFPEGLIVSKAPTGYPTRLSSRPLLTQPFARTSSHLNSFIPSSIALWNSLPSSITNSSSLSSFKYQLSCYLSL